GRAAPARDLTWPTQLVGAGGAKPGSFVPPEGRRGMCAGTEAIGPLVALEADRASTAPRRCRAARITHAAIRRAPNPMVPTTNRPLQERPGTSRPRFLGERVTSAKPPATAARRPSPGCSE